MKIFVFILNFIVSVLAINVAINFGLSPDEDLMNNSAQMLENVPSISVKANQGIFAVDNAYSGSGFTDENIRIDQMIMKTLHSPTATVRKSWFKGKNNHVFLNILFSDGKCEQLEWVPINGSHDVLGEHPAAEAYLHYYVDDSYCRDADSFIGVPDAIHNVPLWLANSAIKMSSKKSVDLVRWSKDHQKESDPQPIRIQVYNALIKEANRFKNEKKYSCTSFVNNVWGYVTGNKLVNDDIMLLSIQTATMEKMDACQRYKCPECSDYSEYEWCRNCKRYSYKGSKYNATLCAEWKTCCATYVVVGELDRWTEVQCRGRPRKCKVPW